MGHNSKHFGLSVRNEGSRMDNLGSLNGMGIAYLPDFAIARQLRERTLVTVLDSYIERSGSLRILWPSSRTA
jgi:DNA-binding transcriptional LysR family regulator